MSPDEELVEAARAVVRARFTPGFHTVGAALRTTDGQVFAAVNLDTYVKRVAVCAEPVALGMAVAAGAGPVDTVVAVRHPKAHEPDQTVRVISPCGMCREMLIDYAPGSTVLMPDDADGVLRRPAAELLPDKFTHPVWS